MVSGAWTIEKFLAGGLMVHFESWMGPMEHAFTIAGPGPVLECGMGYASTPYLHHRCKALGRGLLSLENSQEWIDPFQGMANGQARSGGHEIERVIAWGDAPYTRELWSIALIDQAPGEARAPAVLALRDHADVIVIHDSEHTSAGTYVGMNEALASFPYRAEFELPPFARTTLVSMRAGILPAQVP